MKKLKYIFILLLLLIPVTGKAAIIQCSAPSSVESGETFGVTFYGSVGGSVPFWYARLASEGNATYSSGNLTISGVEESNMSQTVYYTAGDPGTASFYAYDVSVSDGEYEYNDSATCYVEIVSATRSNGIETSSNVYDSVYDDDTPTVISSDPNLSGNYYLKSLEVEGIKLTPAFDKEKLEYSAVVEGNKEKINIKAELEDGTATIEGLGEKALNEGINRFNIKITAQNGEVRAYTVTITRKEKNPIEVSIDKKKYTVAKKEIGLKVPTGFTKTSIVIEKQEVTAYSNALGYMIVALVDEDGKASWFRYNQVNSTYSKYSELNSSNLKLILLDPDGVEVPYGYKKIKFGVKDEEIDGFYLEYNSPYRLVYAYNVETKEKGFYLYDMKENTLQRFYNVQTDIYIDLVKKLEILGVILLALILIMEIVIICQFFVKRKIKKYVTNPKEKEEEFKDDEDDLELIEEKKQKEEKKKEKIEKKEKEKEKELEKTKKQEFTKTVKLELENDYQEQELTKKELKEKKKEEKKALKKAQKDFLE